MILGNAFFIEHRAVLDFANSTVTMNRDGKFYKLVAAQTEQQFSGQPVSDDHVEIVIHLASLILMMEVMLMQL